MIVELFQEIWTGGGGEKPKLRDWKFPMRARSSNPSSMKYRGNYIEELCGRDDLLTGVLQIEGANSEIVCGVQCSL